MKKIDFSAVQGLSLSASSSVSVPTFVRRHRHKPPQPPLCCQSLPALQSITKWCRWRLSHHPLLLRVESSQHWGWRWTSARTCCRCTENPWRPHSQPGNAVRREEEWLRRRQGSQIKVWEDSFRHFSFVARSLETVQNSDSALMIWIHFDDSTVPERTGTILFSIVPIKSSALVEVCFFSPC